VNGSGAIVGIYQVDRELDRSKLMVVRGDLTAGYNTNLQSDIFQTRILQISHPPDYVSSNNINLSIIVASKSLFSY
jgi:hypothetical protein